MSRKNGTDMGNIAAEAKTWEACKHVVPPFDTDPDWQRKLRCADNKSPQVIGDVWLRFQFCLSRTVAHHGCNYARVILCPSGPRGSTARKYVMTLVLRFVSRCCCMCGLLKTPQMWFVPPHAAVMHRPFGTDTQRLNVSKRRRALAAYVFI